MNPLQGGLCQIALLRAGLETRPPYASSKNDTAGHGPRMSEKRYLFAKYPPGLGLRLRQNLHPNRQKGVVTAG